MRNAFSLRPALRFGAVISLCLVLAPVRAATGQGEPSATARMLADSFLLGIRLSVQKAHVDGRVDAEVLDCVQRAKVSRFVPVFNAAVAQNWSAAEVRGVDGFLATPLGKKYAAYSQREIYARVGIPAPSPEPVFSAAEQKKIEAFSNTPAGNRLIRQTQFANAEALERVKGEGLTLLRDCRALRQGPPESPNQSQTAPTVP